MIEIICPGNAGQRATSKLLLLTNFFTVQSSGQSQMKGQVMPGSHRQTYCLNYSSGPCVLLIFLFMCVFLSLDDS